MSAEISYLSTGTGENMYCHIRQVPPHTNKWYRWDTTGSPAMAVFVPANWANYTIALSEAHAAGGYEYLGNWPAGLTAVGWYGLLFYRRDGAAAAITDVMVEERRGYWDGTTFKTQGADTTHVGGTLQTAGDLSAQIAAAGVALNAAGVRGAVGMASANLDTQLSGVPAAVWAVATSTLTTAGSIGAYVLAMIAGVWAYATRTWTSSAAATAAALTGSDLTITIGDTFSAALTGLGSNTAYDTIVWTVKTSVSDADADAILQVRKGVDGVDADDGLRILNGAAATTAAYGSITVVSATAVTLALAADATAELAQAHGLHYSVKAVKADGSASLTLTAASCDVVAYATRATV